EISSEFGYEQEINSAGSKVKVTLARDPGSFGERVDVDFGLEVRFYCADDQFPNGQLIFTGYIANYIPDYNKNCVNIEVYSYGEQLSNYTVQSGQSQLTAMPIDNGAYNTSVWGSAYAVVIKPTSNIRLKSVVLKMARLAGNLPKEKNLTLYSGTPVNDIVGTTAGSFSYTTSNTAIAFTDSAAVPETNPDLVKFDFDTTQILAAGQSYYVLITFDTDEFFYLRGGTAAGDIINGMSYPPIVGGYGYTVSINNSGSTMAQIGGLYCELYSDTGSTVAKYLSEDPSVILKDILTNYSLQGGSVTFDDASIELTGTKVSYTFRSSSVYDALKKCLELSPANWFFYIDHATKKVHFKLKGTTVNHKFVIGKHLQSVNFEDRSENIINSVEFTGGVDDNGVNLYRRYKDTGSVDLYGQKLRIYVDNRVTNPDTADTIANAIIEQYKMPEVRANITILDGVYDIESIRPGDIVGFANAGGSSDSSSNWDAAFWDEGYWDFDVNNPSTLAIQIAKHTYTPEQAIMTLSTVPPDVNKRIEDINRNLEAQQTLNNPEVAEEVVGFGEVTE
ncbi:MAG TPA: phage tail protein, partial [Fibrella sp.]